MENAKALQLSAWSFVAGVVVGWNLNRIVRKRLAETLKRLDGKL